MFEIGPDELKVMNCMVHAESLETVVTETKFPPKVVLDIIRHLVHYRYLKPVDSEGKTLAMFSPDKMKKIRFMLTAKGVDALQNVKK